MIFNDDVNFSDSHYLCVHVSADACVQVSELVSRHRTRLLSKNTGTLAATEAFTTLLHAFRSATTEDILSVLQDSRNKKITWVFFHCSTLYIAIGVVQLVKGVGHVFILLQSGAVMHHGVSLPAWYRPWIRLEGLQARVRDLFSPATALGLQYWRHGSCHTPVFT